MTTQLTTRVRNRLIRSLQSQELVSAEVRKITGWTAPKMSIRNALASIAKQAGLTMITDVAFIAGTNDQRIFYSFR